MNYSGRDESANRNFNSNHFSSRPSTSASHSETFPFSTSNTRYLSTPNQHDGYRQSTGNFYPRAPNRFYGGNYQETYHHSAVMNCPPSHQYQHHHQSSQAHNQYVPEKNAPNAPNGHNRQMPKKKKRSGRGKKNTEEIDEDVHVKENGEWDADFHLFGVESPRSRTIRVSELQETTKL